MKNTVIDNDIRNIVEKDLPWHKLAKKTVLISGANGFLAAYMVKTLLYLNDTKNMGIHVIGLVRNHEKATKCFADYLNRNDLQLITQDVSLPFTITTPIHYIIHAASQASPNYYGIDPVGTLSANVFGTHHLLELAKHHNVDGFLYFSSGEIYGEVDETTIPTQETDYGYVDPLNVRSCYAESKRMGENMCVSYAHQFGVNASIVRPFHIYGPGISLDDGRVYADFVADILHDRDITILGDGQAIRAFCYLSDATVGFFTVLLKGKKSEAYNIGNPYCSLTILALADQLATLFANKKLALIKKTRNDESNYIPSKITINCPDITKMMQLGWSPSVSINEGFQKTVESFLCI